VLKVVLVKFVNPGYIAPIIGPVTFYEWIRAPGAVVLPHLNRLNFVTWDPRGDPMGSQGVAS